MNKTEQISISLTNSSAIDWTSENKLSIGYHWYDEYEQIVHWAADKIVITLPLKSGNSFDQIFKIHSPGGPGRYHLVFDLLDHAETWGKLNGSSTAKVIVDIVAKKQDRDITADIEVARQLWKQKKDQQTIYMCQHILAENENPPVKIFQELALALKSWGRFEASLDAGVRGLNIYPDNPELYAHCARVALDLGQIEKAVSYAKRRVELNKPHTANWAMLGRAYMKNNNFTEAIKAYNHAVDKEENFFWRQELVDCLEHTEQYNEAAIQWSYAIAKDPKNYFLMKLARLYKQAGQMDPALDTYLKIISQDPKNVQAYGFAIEIYSTLGRCNDGLELLEQASKALTPGAELLRAKGNCLLELNRSIEAISAFSQGAKLYPEYIWNWLKIANIQIQQQEFKAARITFENALQNNPEHPEVLFQLASFTLKHEQNPHLALTYYDQSLVQRPEHVITHLYRGRALVKISLWQEAKLAFEKVIQIKPRHAHAHAELGDVFYKLKLVNQARESYTQAIEQGHPNKKSLIDVRDKLLD